LLGIHAKYSHGENMEMKGVIFSYDALLAIAIVIVLFSGITLVSYTGTNDGKTRAMLYTTSSDTAITDYLRGITPPTLSGDMDNMNCAEVFDYNPNGTLKKVAACTKLG